MIVEVLRCLVAGLGVDPDDENTVVGLASVGATSLAWRNSPLEDWHACPYRRISQGEMMRASVATTRLVRDLIHTRLPGVSRVTNTVGDGSVAATSLFDAAERVIADPQRRLPDGRTLVELAPSPAHFGVFAAHVRECARWWTVLAAEHGLEPVLWMLACTGGARCQRWWSTPWWPARVEEFVRRLRDPARWDDPLIMAHLNELSAPRDAADHDELRRRLLAGPDRLSAAGAEYCLLTGLGDGALAARPLIDRRAYSDIMSVLDPETPAEPRSQAQCALSGLGQGAATP